MTELTFDYSDFVLPCLVASRADSSPTRTYLRHVTGDSQTYRQCHEAGLRWASVLRRLGVEEGDRVLSMLPPSFAAINAWIGASWLGAWEVPISTDYRGSLLRFIVENSGVNVAVVQDRLLGRFLELTADGAVGDLKTIVVVGSHTGGDTGPAPGLEILDAELLLRDAAPVDVGGLRVPTTSDVASIIYTSGTTGPSKGVIVTWRQLAGTCCGGTPPDDYGEDDIRYAPFPMCHVLGKVAVLGSAINNSSMVIRDAFSTTYFWEDIAKFRCTTTGFTAAVANFLYRQPSHPGDAETPLRNIVSAPLIPEIDDFCRRFGVRVYTTYNMTELSGPIVSEWNPTNLRSCGRVRPGYLARVVDEHDVDVAPGTAGELIVQSSDRDALMRGYFGMPEETAQAWRGGWFHTGDAFRYDGEGNFYFIDRQKDSIRRRGENISSLEVESEVNAYPSVLESAAIPVPSEWGEDEVMVVVVPRPDMVLDPAALTEFLIGRCPRFMIPRYVDVVTELPKTPVGKIRKSALRDQGVTTHTWDRDAAGIVVPR
jgi:crotonobetaine/carnitine-CoA ligase